MSLAVKFADSSDPVMLCDKEGLVLWQNYAFELLKAGIRDLEDIFLAADKFKILNNSSILCQEVDLSHHFDFTLRFSILSCALGSGDVNDECFLIILKAADYSIQSFSGRENTLSTVAHDLKNPLGAIFGYADALVDTGMGSGLSPKHKDIITRIRSTAVRSIELVRNLQQLSNLSSGEPSITGRVNDLNQVVFAIYKGTWRENMNKPKVSLIPSKTPLPVNVERILADRIITNLYSNALKFTPPDGEIVIKLYDDKDNVFFEINNSAPVIGMDELGKIFESRYRARNSSGTPGTGLGLYIVKEILQKISGSIEVTSNKEKGTTFTARFPKAK